MVCDRDHSGAIAKAVLSVLPQSQRGLWRHACTACTYPLGVWQGEEARDHLRRRIRDLEARQQVEDM